MRLEWWRAGPPYDAGSVDESIVFGPFSGRRIILVESQEEYDLAYALQFMYGSEVKLELVSRLSAADLFTYRTKHARVYTSWDPLDPNRL